MELVARVRKAEERLKELEQRSLLLLQDYPIFKKITKIAVLEAELARSRAHLEGLRLTIQR